MADVRLRAPLAGIVGGAELRLEGTSVLEVLCALEREHPAAAGWILDERSRIRRHINVFVNKQRAQEETAVGPDDRLHVIPAISGGAR